MAISSNHSLAQMQSLAYDYIRIPTPPGSTINSSYSIGAYPTVILIKPNKQIVEKDIWPISNTILRDKITAAGGIAQACGSSIENTTQNSDYIIYPNPADNFINVEYNGKPSQLYTIEVFNTIGQRIIHSEIKSNNNGSVNESVNISTLPNGNYTLRLMSENQLMFIDKIVVVK